MGGIEYVYWPGTSTRLTPWMLYKLKELDRDLRKNFGVHLVLDSSAGQRGVRTEQDQINLFTSRYRQQAVGNGPFGDVRWWQGRRYVRYSGLGTVAQPGTSNHEIQGQDAAIDLADSGGAGIGTMGSQRSNWLRANAHWYGMEPEGFNFNEAWHYKMKNVFQAVPGGKEENMALDAVADYPAFANMLQRAFKFDARPQGVGADYKLGPTVFESLAGAQNKGVTEAQVKSIADAVVKSIGTPTVSVDYARISKDVNDEADKRSLARYTK